MGERLALIVLLVAPGCFGGGGDAGDGDGGMPDAGGEEELGDDAEIAQTGDVVGGYTIDSVHAFVLTDDGAVQYAAGLRDSGDTHVGTGIVRWTAGTGELVVSPDSIMTAFGAYAGYTWLDASGAAWLEVDGCLAVWNGSALAQGPCEQGFDHGMSAGRMARFVAASGLDPWRVEVLDDTGAPTEIVREGIDNGAGVTRQINFVRTTVLGRDGTVSIQVDGVGATTGTSAGIYSGAGRELAPRVDIEWGYPSGVWTLNGTYPGDAIPEGAEPRGPRYPAVNARDDLAFVWSVRSGNQVMPGAGIYSTDAEGTGFRLHVDLTANLPGADAAAMFAPQTYEPQRLLYALTATREVIFTTLLTDGRIGLWREDRGDLELIALPGQAAVDTAGRALAGVTIAEVGSFVASESGALMFAARVEGAGVTPEDQYRVYGVTSLPTTRVSEMARTGEMWLEAAGLPVLQVRLDGFLVPDSRASGPLALYPVSGSTRIAWGSEAFGRTIDGAGCGAALLVVDNGSMQRLVKRVIDPMCKNANKVNSTGDDDDVAPGDGACNTGGNIAGKPECTLRAALTETNARPGHDVIEFGIAGPGPHTIAVGDELPHVTESVFVMALEPVIVDGGGIIANGFTVESPSVSIQGLTFRNFGGNGVQNESDSELELRAVSSLDNCGWGVWSSGSVRVRAGSGPSVWSGNGAGSGCSGGGLVAATLDAGELYSAWLDDVEIRDNNGPGVLANAVVRANGLTVAGNAGDGIAVSAQDDINLRYRLASYYGDITVTGNRGHGLKLERGGVFMQETTLTATDNGGWGVWLDQGQARLGKFNATSRPTPHDISRNGAGTDCVHWAVEEGPTPVAMSAQCGGGGVAILDWEPALEESDSLIDLAIIADNAGPGVLSTDELRLRRLTVTGNRGPGITQRIHDEAPQNYAMFFDFGPTLIAGNQGDGVYAEHGGILGAHTLMVQDNAGWGIRSDAGSVRLPARGTPTSWRTHVTGNGAGVTCHVWAFDGSGYPITHTEPCTGGGVRCGEGDVDGIELFVTGNTGPGIEALLGSGSFGNGDIDLTLGQVCDNSGGDLVADGAIALNAVDQTCP